MRNISGVEMTNIEMVPDFPAQAKIKVIGVGGAGGNAVNRMIEEGLEDVDFITVNTDAAALEANQSARRIQIGEKLTKGLGAGANPNVGREAILENRDEVAEELQDSDMVFIAAGMGGGTGTGAAPVVAEIARELNILTVAVVTKPFLFEGKVRDRNSKYGIDELRKHVDSIIVVDNQKLLSVSDKSVSILDSFKVADGVLTNATRGISDLITMHGFINVDFADVKSIMSGMGDALMGVGHSEDPENRAILAAEQAIKSPLLADIDIAGSQGLLVNFKAGPDLSLFEINKAHEYINGEVGEDADVNIIFGAIIDAEMSGKVEVTVVATGFNKNPQKKSPLIPVAPVSQPKAAPAPTQETFLPPVEEVNENKEIIDVDPVAPVDQPWKQQTQTQTQAQTSTVTPPVQQEQHRADGFVGKNISDPAWKRKEHELGGEETVTMDRFPMGTVVSKDSDSGAYTSSGGAFPSAGNTGDIETPAYLRQQMQ